MKTATYSFDDVVVDRANFRVYKGDLKDVLALPPRAFDLLVYLIEHRTRVVDKQEIFEHVWAGAFVTDNALTRAVTDLRRAIGDSAESPRYIETVQKRGYRFIANVAVDASTPSAAAVVDTRPTTSWRAVALVCGAAFIAAAAWWWGYLTNGVSDAPIGTPRAVQITTWQGLDLDPTLSPDGQTIAYASSRSGTFEIYLKPLTAGAREIQLTADGQENLQPAWSPDGTRIAYHSRTRAGIWMVPASGGAPRQVAEFGSSPAWSPDGAAIVFQSYALTDLSATSVGALPPSQLWKASLGGGEPIPLTDVGTPSGGHGAPSWSADGTRLVFVSYDGTSASLWTVAADGTDLKPVTGTRGWVYDPVFSPDRRNVYYGGVSELGAFVLYRLPIAGDHSAAGPPLEIANTGLARVKHLAISADGRRLVYSAPAMAGALVAAPLMPDSGRALGSPIPLTHDTAYRKGLPRTSPDGQRVAYVEFRGGVSQDIWVMNADGREPVQLTTDPAIDWAPSWFPDNDRIAFQSDRQGVQRLWSVSTKTGREAILAEPGREIGWPVLSRDGRQVAFNSPMGGAINAWTMAIGDGSGPAQRTFDAEMMGWPSWSPDGTRLALQMKRGDDTHVAVLPSHGGPPTQLTFERGQSWPYSWSPHGDKVAFAALRDGIWNVFWVSLGSKAVEQVTHYTKLNSYVRYPDWSPVDDRIVYEYSEIVGNIWMMELR